MPRELARLLSIYSLEKVLEELWWGYRWALFAVVVWLGATLFALWRQRRASTVIQRPVQPALVDLWTLPILLVGLQAVRQLHTVYDAGHWTPHAWLAIVWLGSAAGFAAVLATLLLSTLAAVVGRVVLRVEVSLVPRLALPGVAALCSLALLWLLFWACIHVGVVYPGAGEGAA